jgi:hypothetical protein
MAAWVQVLIELVIPFWTALPSRFWTSTATFPEWISSTSSDFMRVAFGFDIVTVFSHGHDNDNNSMRCDAFTGTHKVTALSGVEVARDLC